VRRSDARSASAFLLEKPHSDYRTGFQADYCDGTPDR
jgi:hypothetical protein